MVSGSCTRIFRKLQGRHIIEDELGKAKNFRICSIARPHMRAFHTSWFCFFIAFTSWFGVQPLIPTIKKELGLTKVEIANTGTASIAATILIRVIIGPLCDRFGPRRAMSALLLCGAIPMALVGLVKNGTQLLIVRLCIGVLGGTFVPCQFWTSVMFNTKIVGTANAIVGGWGNLGGGFTFLLMPGIFEGIKAAGADEFLAWKIAVAIPSVICITLGIIILFSADDSPQGSWKDRKTVQNVSDIESAPKGDQNNTEQDNPAFDKKDPLDKFEIDTGKPAITDIDTEKEDEVQVEDKISEETTNSCKHYFGLIVTVFILIVHYGMSFGIEISVNTVLNLYLLYKFKKPDCVESTIDHTTVMFASNFTTSLPPTTTPNEYQCSILDQTTASLIASLFGLMNLFARALGGLFSDVLRTKLSLPGRILAHFICILGEGMMLIIFSQIESLSVAIFIIVLFSICVQMTEGTTYAMVPYTSPKYMGVVAGLVGAGGNTGSLIWNIIWSRMVEDNPSHWFLILGIIVSSFSVLSVFIALQGQRLLNICFCKSKKTYELS